MPELDFAVHSAEPLPFAAAPHLQFKLRVRDADVSPRPIHSAVLRCQIRIEPTQRRYDAAERERLFELFGPLQDWSRTLHSMLWTHVNVVVPGFTGETIIDMPTPCSYDLSIAAAKYFAAVEDGEIPFCFLFSGTVFYEADGCGLQAMPIPWEKEAAYRLPARIWTEMMDRYYPNTVWVRLSKEAYDRIDSHKRRQMLTSWEQALESLLPPAKAQAMP